MHEIDRLLPSLRAMSASERKAALAGIHQRDPTLHDELLDALWGQTVTVAHEFRSSDLCVGDLVGGKYKIIAPLGDGASGSVFRAIDVEHVGDREFDTREVAIKVSRIDTGHDSLNRDLLQKEARLLRRLRHPRLPHVEALFEENGRWILVMEYIEGDSLKDRQRAENGCFAVAQVTGWVRDTLRVLDYLHTLHSRPSKEDGAVVTDKPIYHRDIKPANLVLDAHDNLYVVDLGIARSGISELTEIAPSLVGRGSAGYAPPEIDRGEGTTAQSDLYSLGMTAFSLLTNEPARDYSARRRMEEKGVSGVDPFEATLNDADLPNHTRDWIRTSTALLPQDRYENAAVMARALEPRPAPPGTGSPSPGRSRVPFTVGAIALACAVLIALSWPLLDTPHTENLPTSEVALTDPTAREGETSEEDTAVQTTLGETPPVELEPRPAPPPSVQPTSPLPAQLPPPPTTAPAAVEPEPVRGGTIQATVLADDASPLAGAQVTVVQTGAHTTADAQGDIVLENIPAGTHELLVRAPGYVDKTFRATVEVGGVLARTLQFEIEDLELSAY
ncbi:MAG: hypothetical protein Rubg2KO_06330 [Rubricoccaceae bacterium]